MFFRGALSAISCLPASVLPLAHNQMKSPNRFLSPPPISTWREVEDLTLFARLQFLVGFEQTDQYFIGECMYLLKHILRRDVGFTIRIHY